MLAPNARLPQHIDIKRRIFGIFDAGFLSPPVMIDPVFSKKKVSQSIDSSELHRCVGPIVNVFGAAQRSFFIARRRPA
ncbi:MAG TPA: hypothetical protein DD666_20915 [Advenella kashmirensis]|uniref:Uncharacterized protein n=1 Tax=Advenella kashmirensis TaxID=310575 RepID=A0A356LMA5_9BURK|nr:hypothetical protein [Advenella kashmirensis]